MNDALTIIVLYRTVSMVIGFLFALLGYRLFIIGITADAGEFKAAWGANKLALKRTGPGTFFALFGMIIISVNLVKGPSVTSKKSYSNVPQINKDIDKTALSIIEKSIEDSDLNNKEVKAWNEWVLANDYPLPLKLFKADKPLENAEGRIKPQLEHVKGKKPIVKAEESISFSYTEETFAQPNVPPPLYEDIDN